MAESLVQGKRFFCREWVFSKLWHCLENLEDRPVDETSRTGVLIVGGPGAGKTALCSEIVQPTGQGRQRSLRKRLLAHHFCTAHDPDSTALTPFIAHIADQLRRSPLIPLFRERVSTEDIASANGDPDSLFKRLVLFPLLEVERPPHGLLLLVDSLDEANCLPNPGPPLPCSPTSKTIGELVANHAHLLPPWLVLVCTARKQSKAVARLFSGFRKIGFDDLRKGQVVRDVQQYILSRLDQDSSLRQHISRETAEMLNQLHIKSNGCFLYLEKVLDGISENFIVLREIREIPGTLYGLYLWLCQRLFTKKQFLRVEPILSLLLAAPRPLSDEEIFLALRAGNAGVSKEDFAKRLHVLRRITRVHEGRRIVFHHSFAEWLLDVKHCTQKYLCHPNRAHGALLVSRASARCPPPIQIAHHLLRAAVIDPPLSSLLLLSSGATLANLPLPHGLDTKMVKLLEACGARRHLELQPPPRPSPAPTESFQDEGGGEAPCEANDDYALEEEQPQILEDVHQTDSNLRTPLHNAANEGNLELLKLLIAHGSDIEAIDKHGRTPLNLAARQGHEKIIEALLEANAKFNHANHDGWTPLRSAAWAGHVAVVDALLAKGAKVDLTDGDGRTALRAAAWGGHEEVVASLLRAGASPSLADNEGRTPLIAAAYMGHAEIVEKILAAGADVNHSDSDGRTALSVAALCVAASQGHLRVVNLLLEKGAAVDHQDKDGTTPLLVAAFEGHKEVCELLLEYEADVDAADKAARTPLWAAASMGHASVAELLLFWGAYVDHIDGEGRTVLSVAAAQGNVGVVRLLLARGLDEGHRDNAGWTPLHYASFEGHVEATEGLLEAGARINDVDNDGKHALLLAAQEGHIHVVESLINYGADVEQKSHDGRSPLRAAAMDGFKDVVQLLIRRDGDVNYRDADGRSTLYLLALENRVGMAQFLIRCGASVECRDLEGRTPLHVSAWQGHLEMVELLVSAGAVVDGPDNDKRTPLQSASWQGHANIVRLLCERAATVDHQCNQGATALCIAAQEGHVECVRILLEWGANPNHSDRCGRTPLRVALKSGHASISRLLKDAVKGLSVSSGGRGSGELQASSPVAWPEETSSPPPEIERRRELFPSMKTSVLADGLSFTQQVEQVSRKGRPTSRLLSPHDKKSPIYASPPQSPTSDSLHDESPADRFSNGLPPFAFNRDSHMKIILGDGAGKWRKNGTVSGGNSGISALRSGLNAIKAGVLEAAAGLKTTSDDSPLVSAASMAVPNLVQTRRSNGSSWKKETPL